MIDKESLNFKDLEHVLIEKVEQLFRDMLMTAMFRSKALQHAPWLCQLRARKPAMVAAVALANKIARTVWAVMRHAENWRPAAASRSHEPAAVLAGIKTTPPSAVAFGQS